MEIILTSVMFAFIGQHKIFFGVVVGLLMLILFVGGRHAEKQKRTSANVKKLLGTEDKTPTLAAGRSFFMGMTPMSYDVTKEALGDTYAFIRQNGDLVAQHLDEGIPWPEALERKPYHPNVERDLDERQRLTTKNKKVYLAITPVRDGLATYWGKKSQMERPGVWKDKRIDDAEAITAYLNFARDLIRRFQPDFMAYGIEVNQDLAKDKERWSQFVTMAREVYTALKKEYPALPLFLTIQIDHFWQDPERQQEALKQILPYTDYIAVSTYPYVFGYFDPRTIPQEYFSRLAALAPEKPFAVAETGFVAKNYDALGKQGSGSAEWQNRYLGFALEESQKLRAKFFVWFVPIDYDRLWEKFRFLGPLTAIFKVWLNCGLLDGDGNPRPSFATWTGWFRSPKS